MINNIIPTKVPNPMIQTKTINRMTHQQKSIANPLEEFAAQMSETLGGDRVELTDTSIENVQGGQIQMKYSSAQSVEAHAIHLEESVSAVVRTNSLDVNDSGIAFLSAQQAKLKNVTNSVLAANHVEARDVRTVVLLAGRVEGKVRTLLTVRTALAIGAGFYLASLLVRTVFSRIPTIFIDGKTKQNTKTNIAMLHM